MGEVLYGGGFSCSGIRQGPQGASSSREDRAAVVRVSQGTEHVPLEGTSPAGHPSSCMLSSLGCPRLHPDLLFHMTYPSNIPGHPGTSDT